ncbi:hypothetical protein H6G41_17940 [Tolypothrix sp. FACHB-123]|uniref:hypothetical protein n=1 Tax=Tolypothrix sp. FACHB-123 TaxID=2692868 RepID=UPI0016877A16|nr:hypothetical protein [Tolypothrix sp. FACHB-123]MBD2356483.1 hypothetical protein [Tolypothrix sp. FACHB-123]
MPNAPLAFLLAMAVIAIAYDCYENGAIATVQTNLQYPGWYSKYFDQQCHHFVNWYTVAGILYDCDFMPCCLCNTDFR